MVEDTLTMSIYLFGLNYDNLITIYNLNYNLIKILPFTYWKTF